MHIEFLQSPIWDAIMPLVLHPNEFLAHGRCRIKMVRRHRGQEGLLSYILVITRGVFRPDEAIRYEHACSTELYPPHSYTFFSWAGFVWVKTFGFSFTSDASSEPAWAGIFQYVRDMPVSYYDVTIVSYWLSQFGASARCQKERRIPTTLPEAITCDVDLLRHWKDSEAEDGRS